jgi:hypothetical protein
VEGSGGAGSDVAGGSETSDVTVGGEPSGGCVGGMGRKSVQVQESIKTEIKPSIGSQRWAIRFRSNCRFRCVGCFVIMTSFDDLAFDCRAKMFMRKGRFGEARSFLALEIADVDGFGVYSIHS